MHRVRVGLVPAQCWRDAIYNGDFLAQKDLFLPHESFCLITLTYIIIVAKYDCARQAIQRYLAGNISCTCHPACTYVYSLIISARFM